jgi:hypothetical protein
MDAKTIVLCIIAYMAGSYAGSIAVALWNDYKLNGGSL